MSRRDPQLEPVVLAVHMHCYQPPREEPATGEVLRQPSAAPYHDWNARIAAECYRPNAFARILSDDGRLVGLVNNYEHVSFNFGPTLLSWLERFAPDAYRRVIAADAGSRNAMAQVYNHMILPLATERDQRTQVRWGLADFRHRFGRDADGMWLAETAVNEDVLRVMVEEGVRFTILAPTQALQFRPLGRAAWSDVADGSIDTRRSYRWLHPAHDGRGLDIVFYDGPLSRAIAFDPDATSSQVLVGRTIDAAPEGGIVCVAADGETFGHHRKWVDRSLAYALTVEAPRRGVRVTSVAQYVREHQPEHQVQVQESAWSCAHGVGRWARDCGCSTGGEEGEQQKWRAPLRAALNVLRDFGIDVFERRGSLLFHGDGWEVRDAYIAVVIGSTTQDEFAARWCKSNDAEARADAFRLLDAQHQAMLMYTSCGWFFHDLAGIETIQVLRHAHQVITLLDALGEPAPVDQFLATLAQGRSNDPSEGDGRAIWQRHVEHVEARIEKGQRDDAIDELAHRHTDVTVALVSDQLDALAAVVADGGHVPRDLRPAVASACQRMVDDAVAKAVATGDGLSAAAALDAIHLARKLDAPINIERSQELVYDALRGGATALADLGHELFLALDALGHPG